MTGKVSQYWAIDGGRKKETLVDVMEKVCTVANKTTGKRMTNKKYHYIYGIKVAFERLTTSKRTSIVGTILQKGYQGFREQVDTLPLSAVLTAMSVNPKVYRNAPPQDSSMRGSFGGIADTFLRVV